MPLVSSRWLANSATRKAWIEFHTTGAAVSITVHTKGKPSGDPSIGTIKASSARRPACGASAKASEVGQYGKQIGFGAQLYAVLDIEHRIRTYRVPTEAETAGAFVEAKTRLQRLPELADGTSAVPDERITKSQFRICGALCTELTPLQVYSTPVSYLCWVVSLRECARPTTKCFVREWTRNTRER